jgi:hypothetical protein
LEASILDLNLMLRHRAAGNGTALRKLASREDVMNESKHTGFNMADITALSRLYRGEVTAARCGGPGSTRRPTGLS